MSRLTTSRPKVSPGELLQACKCSRYMILHCGSREKCMRLQREGAGVLGDEEVGEVDKVGERAVEEQRAQEIWTSIMRGEG